MPKVAALFPGQGSQKIGMGQDLAHNWPKAMGVFDTVDKALEKNLSGLCWNGPEEDLRLTENTQPALLAHSIAAWEVLREAGLKVDAVAGHSLGEYSAVVCAGGLDLASAAQTVRLRGRLMQEAVPVGRGAMSAVIGLDDDAVRNLCAEASKETSEAVVAANFNAPGQVVIAGTTGAVEAAGEKCREAGARRVLPLPVSAPFHSPLMAPAREGLNPELEELPFADLSTPLYRNVDAQAVTAGDAIRDGLVRQVDMPVLWTQTIKQMREDGFEVFIEIGTGAVLSGLVRRIDRAAQCHSVGTVADVEKLLEHGDLLTK
ncbi:MAG: ACP S-malonyltransferase [bacterium]|nr:ACP S-malonyltransferase [bacterium]